MADLHLQGESLALAHGADTAQDLGALQVVQGADLIVRPPFAPVGGQAFEQGLDVGRTVGGGVVGVVVAHGICPCSSGLRSPLWGGGCPPARGGGGWHFFFFLRPFYAPARRPPP